MALSRKTREFLDLVKVGNYIEKEAKGNDLLKILLPVLGVGGLGALAYSQRDAIEDLLTTDKGEAMHNKKLRIAEKMRNAGKQPVDALRKKAALDKQAKKLDLLKILLPALGVGGLGALAYSQRDAIEDLLTTDKGEALHDLKMRLAEKMQGAGKQPFEGILDKAGSLNKEAKKSELLKILLPLLGVGGVGALAYSQRDAIMDLLEGGDKTYGKDTTTKEWLKMVARKGKGLNPDWVKGVGMPKSSSLSKEAKGKLDLLKILLPALGVGGLGALAYSQRDAIEDLLTTDKGEAMHNKKLRIAEKMQNSGKQASLLQELADFISR